MDVDAGRVEEPRGNNTDRAKLRAEGRCFECQKQGHLRKDCPVKKGNGSAPKPSFAPKCPSLPARVIAPDKETEPKDEVRDLASRIAQLDQEESEALFQALVDGRSGS